MLDEDRVDSGVGEAVQASHVERGSREIDRPVTSRVERGSREIDRPAVTSRVERGSREIDRPVLTSPVERGSTEIDQPVVSRVERASREIDQPVVTSRVERASREIDQPVVTSRVERGSREIDRPVLTSPVERASREIDRPVVSRVERASREIDRPVVTSRVERASREIDQPVVTSRVERGWREIDRPMVTSRVERGSREIDRLVVTSRVERGWREIDRQMRRIAKRRAALDAEEAPVLLAAMRAEVHVHLGYGTFAEYLERVCGYTAHTARERMRVAEALETMPETREALAAGDVSYSAVRELTRKVNAETEGEWLGALQGCTVREVEDALRGRKVGDLPDDRPDPALEERVVRMRLPPDVYALFLEARRNAEREAGESMTDAEFMAIACRRMLDGEQPATGNRPAHTIAITTCRECKRGWHETGSVSIELPPDAIEQAQCDAIELGDVDGDTPAPTTRTIPAPIRRAVLARDHHRCVVPGCRSSSYIDVHHLVPFAAGGPHELPNLITLCTRHHAASHAGRVNITGTPGALVVTHADGRSYGAPPGASGPDRPAPAASPAGRPHTGPLASSSAPTLDPSLITDARSALINLGMKPADATAAIVAATSHMDRVLTLEALIRASLRSIPRR